MTSVCICTIWGLRREKWNKRIYFENTFRETFHTRTHTFIRVGFDHIGLLTLRTADSRTRAGEISVMWTIEVERTPSSTLIEVTDSHRLCQTGVWATQFATIPSLHQIRKKKKNICDCRVAHVPRIRVRYGRWQCKREINAIYRGWHFVFIIGHRQQQYIRCWRHRRSSSWIWWKSEFHAKSLLLQVFN